VSATAARNGRLNPGELSAGESELRAAFLREVECIPGGERLRRCIQCGTCSGSCPVSYAMDVQPRELVALFRAGDIESILRSRTIWICASCYACTVRCPSAIKITDLIYGLKRIAMRRHIRDGGAAVFTLSRLFTRLIRRYGRNQELALVRNFFLRHSPWRLVGLLPLGWRMWRVGRLPWRTRRIREIEGLRRIIAKAETMELSYPREARREFGKIGYAAVSERAVPGGGSA